MMAALSMVFRAFVCNALLVAMALAAPVKVLVLGDSLSAAHNIPPSAGWVALLQARLREPDRLRPGMPAPEVINASISGETSAGGLARLPELLARHRPQIVVLELGGNDGLRGQPPAQLAANLEAMIGLSRAAGAQVLLLGIDLPSNYGNAYRERIRRVYQDLAQRLNVPLVPFLLDGIALDPARMQADGIHPTADAQPAVLDNVWPLLREML